MRILLITGKSVGHNLFPVKEVLEDAGHDVEIVLLLQAGEKYFKAADFDTVLMAKQPSVDADMNEATFERTLEALNAMHAHKSKVRLGMVSYNFAPKERDMLAQRGFAGFFITELKKIEAFAAGKP